MLNRTALTVFLYASFLYFLKRIVFVKRHVWFFRIYRICLVTTSFDGSKLVSRSSKRSFPVRLKW